MMEKIISFNKSLGIEYTGFTELDGKTAVVCLFPYYTEKKDGSNISLYTYSEDYHIILKKYLSKIENFILENGYHTFGSYSDISPYNDREVARNAGLGVIGKNNLLINEKYGSFVFIGYILTDIDFNKKDNIPGKCLNCGKCVKSCPSNCLKTNDYSVCISHLTQKKGPLTDYETSLIKKGGLVFGCDVCQLVCPMNKFVTTPITEFYQNRIYNIEKDMIFNISNREFKRKYQNRAFSWRGRGVLARNYEIIYGE